MALTPETRPLFKADPSMNPPNTIQPQVGVFVDAAGIMHRAYMSAYVNAAGQPSPAPGVGSASNFSAVTPSDSTVLPAGLQGLWVGGTGALVVKGLDGVTATFSAVPAGTLIRGQFTRVMAATTATLITAMV